ncbi:membrane protein [Luminiphilus syltensis NOR5-1B]|uniref:Membrane protein n=1 Tax=Luminiphilus syltensis NOR5-1B TaxID=565045 RepID=B8KWR5_9GAMM|nr:YqaA family protein [Luminiphilus syltensis]EED36881.1 membrane protein [Luminiphilus syltensis NOR5-1B]
MISDYLILFSSSFLAATILPFYSEVTLYLLLRDGADPTVLLFVATVGNTLGSVVNWALGRYLLHFQDRRWFYFSREQIARAQSAYQKRGVWSLLLAWLPIGGDALTLVAGIMRVRLSLFIILVGIGKGLRYLFVIGVAQV